jgi:uncharacterized protein (DUF885 family)
MLGCAAVAAAQDSTGKLSEDYWRWRAQHQPFNNDDIPRIERPAGLKYSWSEESIAQQRKSLAVFDARWKAMAAGKRSMPQQVDYELLGSALARVHWELDVNRRWQRDPSFYVEQTMTAFTETLLPPPPIDATRSHEVIARLQNIPSILEEARANLQQPSAPFARLAVASLENIRKSLAVVQQQVAPLLAPEDRSKLGPAIESAATALEEYREWLQKRLTSMPEQSAIGRDAYVYFFKNVALYPFTPEELLAQSRLEWARSVAAEQLERQHNLKVPPLKMFRDANEQIAATAQRETEIRRYLVEHELLSIPEDFPRYTIRPMPSYLSALDNFGELDDFTGPSRLQENCVRWVANPSEHLGYFAKAGAQDPRPGVVHEGVPGHYLQLWLGWKNPDPVRQHYYDSGANEGLGFYAEEMMMEAGLFDDSPHAREINYSFMRLRALRVEVDVRLALGEFTLDQAADYLARMVPMDSKTARSEAALFATQPGQAISYQAGKLQIVTFLAEARTEAGDRFDLREFDDFVWRNGNVPIELLRREWFARADQISPRQ